MKEVDITADVDFIINACDGIWDCFTNEEAIKYIRRKKEAGPRTGKLGLSPTKLKSEKSLNLGKKQGSAPLKLGKKSSELSSPTKLKKPKGETSFIIEDMMN